MSAFPFSDSVVELLSRPAVMLAFAAELDFESGMVRAHTGTGPLVINGETFDGVGQFGAISAPQEALDSGSPKSVTLTLSGLDADLIAGTQAERCRGRFGRLLLVAIDDDGSYAADILFSGKMDAPQFSYDGNDGENQISVTITDRMADWQREGTERWTDENHRQRHPGDRFFFAVAQLADWPIYWGAKKDAPSFSYPK
ncbi:hypothetical protein EVC62_02115 [Salinicola endophyticus]|uniref:Phage tail protein n=1 Tax=Salinicola endophyticus TaxID=1949083 RepID=A0ABY8FKI0_9GAMM|nr:hypothetical protein [Salinicola endophyticus]WFF40389.1 hypothetical protein EVC62_02115 [Salinicola endophyticus]